VLLYSTPTFEWTIILSPQQRLRQEQILLVSRSSNLASGQPELDWAKPLETEKDQRPSKSET